jgi:hypothetical protein
MTWLLRGAFILLIAATLAWKLAEAPPLEHSSDTKRALEAVLQGRLAGAIASQPWGGPTDASLILTAPVTGCAAPLTVVTVFPSFDSAPALLRIQPSGSHHLFAYLDWVSDRPERWTLLRLRAREKIQAALGLGPDTAADRMLFIAEPAGCAQARAIPWRRFWAAR